MTAPVKHRDVAARPTDAVRPSVATVDAPMMP